MSFSALEEAFRRKVRDFRPADIVRRREPADYLAILAALHRRATTGTGQYIDVAMAATLMAVNERAHVDLNDADLGAEPAILGATDCPFFEGPRGEHFTVATILVLRLLRHVELISRSCAGSCRPLS